MAKKIRVTETALRDAHQSLIATRMPTEEMHPILDKLDKIGIDNVNEELRNDGLPEEAIAKLQPVIKLEGSNDEKLAVMEKFLQSSEVGL